MSDTVSALSWPLWRLKQAGYSLWRLRRVIVLCSVLPFLALSAGLLLAIVFFPHLVEFGVLELLDLIALPALPTFFLLTVVFVILFPTAMISYVYFLIPSSIGLFVFPCLFLALGADATNWLVLGMMLSIFLMFFGLLALHQNPKVLRYRGAFEARNRIRIAKPAWQVFESRKLQPGQPAWDGYIEKIRSDPDHADRVILQYVGGNEIWRAAKADDTAFVLRTECGSATDPLLTETTEERVRADGADAIFEYTSRPRNMPLLHLFCLWLDDYLKDYNVYFRDQLEGRRSLSIKAARLRKMKKKTA